MFLFFLPLVHSSLGHSALIPLTFRPFDLFAPSRLAIPWLFLQAFAPSSPILNPSPWFLHDFIAAPKNRITTTTNCFIHVSQEVVIF